MKADAQRRLIEVQVKTAMNSGWKYVNWPLGDKSQTPSASEQEYFVMVGVLANMAIAPRFFVLPRAHVAAAAWITHQHWLTEPGIPAGKRNVSASRSRVHVRTFEKYEDRWDLLDIDEHECPVLLPPSIAISPWGRALACPQTIRGEFLFPHGDLSELVVCFTSPEALSTKVGPVLTTTPCPKFVTR